MTAEVPPVYSPAERDRRYDLARGLMTREGLDALLVLGERESLAPSTFAFDNYFTNDRPGTTIVFPRDGQPISLVPMAPFVTDHIEASRRGDAVWIRPENIRVGRTSDGIARVIRELELTTASMGVVGLEPYLPQLPEGVAPYRLWNAVQAQFPEAVFKRVGTALARLMMPLSEEEVAMVRWSAAIGDAMARAMVQAAGPGVGEAEVYAAGMNAAAVRGAVVPPMHLWSGAEPVGAAPPAWAYRPQAPRLLQEGDLIISEVFSSFGMRATQHQVTISVGDMHEDVRRAGEVVRAAYDAGLHGLRAGRTFGEVAEEMLAPARDAGGWVSRPQVHGLNPFGMLCGFPGDLSELGAEGYPPVTGMPTVLGELELEPGMSFAFEPSCGFGRHTATIGGTVVVGLNGPIELNPYTSRILEAGGPSA